MGRRIFAQLQALFSPPDFADPEKTLVARQVTLILRAFIVSSIFIQAIQIAIAPWITGRWLALLLGTIAVSAFLLVLNHRGRVLTAASLMVASLWLLITILAWTRSGLGTRAAWGYFIVVFIAGMTLGRWPAVAAAVACSASTLAVALWAAMPSSDPFRFWLINTIYLLAGLLLQNLAVRSIRASMAEALGELRERQQAQAALLQSERKHREMVNSLPFCVFEADLDGRIRFVNQTGLEWFGYSPADVAAGVSIFQILDPDDAGRARENLSRLLAGEEIASREYRVRRQDGSPFTALVRTRIIREGGPPPGLQGSLVDISDRKRAEKEREQVISLLRATVESTADGILVVDAAGKIAHFNQRFKEMWRIPDDVLAESRDETALSFVLDQLVDPDGFLSRVQHLYGTPLSESFDLLEFKDGRCFERYSRPQMLAGQPVGRVWSFRDVSEHKQAEKKLQESEHRYRALFESANDGILLLQGTRFIDCNMKILELFGYTREQFSTIPQARLSPEKQPDGSNSREKAMEKYSAALAGHSQRFDWTYLRSDGTSFPAEVSLDKVELSSGIHLLIFVRDITERKQAEEKHIESERRYRTLFESAGEAILLLQGNRIVDCNSRALDVFGCSREQIIGLPISHFHPPLQPDGSMSLEKGKEKNSAARRGDSQFFDWRHIRFDGTPFDAEVSLNKVELGSEPHLLAIVRDITDRRRLEEQLLQAQKMEAVGILAGGVAHDFNNILSTIVGYGSLLQLRMQAEPQSKEYIDKILDSCERAVRLTSSLLTFSRKQEIELQALDINDAIFSFHKILARLIGEDIEVRIDLASQALTVDADVRQIEQVLMNLATNSRDAMPQGGRLTISTSAVEYDQDAGEIPRGAYAAVRVADSGSGMAAEVQAHIFEPFFTTKEVGKGTGLGLAIVYGIVKKHSGFITVASAPGQGTTFTIYLPLKSPPAKEAKRRKREKIPSGSETILLIEDDAAVRQVTRSMLEEFGYTVLEAEDGEIAQQVFRRERERIRLVLCDLIMPRLNGRETLAAIRRMRPGTKAIFMSGYTADVIAGKGIADAGAHLLLKPLSPGLLLRQVRAVLDEA